MRLHALISAAALSAGLFSAVGSAQITGKVMLVGDPPEPAEIKAMAAVPQCAALHKDPVYEDSVLVSDKNELQNVIVFIKPADGQKLSGPQLTKPAVLDQKGCMYSPHVLAVQIGQPVIIRNSDGFLHNIHTLSIDNTAFNVAQVAAGDMPIKPFTVAEEFPIKCDVHPWMNARCRVFDNPYFSTTDKDGNFSIDTAGLADGTYTIQAWHEKYKDSAPQQVQVKGGKIDKPLEFKYDAKAAKAQAKPAKGQVSVASRH